ncbi:MULTISPECIES: ATP-binding cassette domain-containing protein [unclassified Cupriavidus]|uniref:ABC transporter ATP-binding protein n=1 Tax=unclassified Cupriavidus TaxID=2640874 RepID=UPI001C00780D|nr:MULTISPECIES: ATP-binding cassette domain-containing protein [unclassified Cupriavidus]MCA3184335.1 ABC transporter ATP-binding protein [Cupriavidus sp.]MCA3189071.1 ABC transporter ATP-binding protein [Cupriavidus sp.]MCA3198790.1 ABC transporter ATP-binding protein [Cupriavidus sp.]MCA3201536.1 ABC transporter ATP-binding protein [Cupriavidus sp.]MCA3207187.1 ABC transporter ATP-binding protein [Cupriavidus sp.]
MSIDITPLLTVSRLRVAGAEGQLVGPVSFEMHAGRALTLLGESGSGKSLLAQAIMGTLPAGLQAEGDIAFGGQSFAATDAIRRRKMWGRQVALLPQEPWLALDPTMRVGSQLAESHALVGGRSRADAWTATLGDLASLGMTDVASLWPGNLSGGMAQRVAFAITRAGGAPVLIVDEPTKGLDHVCRDDIIARLQAALRAGCAVLTITHDIAVARALGGDVSVMLAGKIVEAGPAGTLLSEPSHDYSRALVAADPGNWSPGPSATPGAAVLRAVGLSKRFGNREIFRDVDLELRAGECVAVTGPSGSGKSTLGNALLGLVATDAGQVHRQSNAEAVRFQKIYQEPASAFAPRRPIGRALDDLCAMHRIDRADIAPLMTRMRLAAGLLKRRPGEVSGGELQRFALLRTLLLRPVFLFADEPTSRLDPITQKKTLDLILESAREHDCALMLVTHDLNIARCLARRRLSLV